MLLMKMMVEKRQEMTKMRGRTAQACLLPTCILLKWTMTLCLSMAMTITVSDDMNTVTQGNVLTNLQRVKLLGIVQDMLNPSITVRGREVADNKSETARLKMKMFRGVLRCFFLQ